VKQTSARRRLLLASALTLLAGCAEPPPGPPPLLRAAARQTRAGEAAYLTGHADEAVPALAESVHLHLAAGDTPGACRALLNLALAERGAGDAKAAGATARQLRGLAPAARQQAAEAGAVSEADAASAWLDALLALDQGDSAAAASLLAGAPAGFAKASPWPGRLETLRAEIALGQGRFAEALAHAQAGRTSCAAAHDQSEEARALRLAGSARIGLGKWLEARADFLAAVHLEELLGGGARMAGDLDHLATIAEHLGDREGARLYTQRARAIAGEH